MGAPAVVLVHGLIGPGGNLARKLVRDWSYFHRVEQRLREKHGLRTLSVHLGRGPPEERATRLVEQLHAWPERRPGERVTLVGHSQGGLCARWALSQLDAAGLARQLISLGTPHRGSSLCDKLVGPMVDRFPGLAGALRHANIQTDAARYLSVAYCADFNARCPDSADVTYRSLAGMRRRKLDYWTPFMVTRPLLQRFEGENDGLVSVESAKWGEFLGTYELDHIEMINYPLKPIRKPPWAMWDDVAALCM